MHQKGNIFLGILIGFLIAGGLFGAYYLGTRNNKPQPQNPVVTSTPQPSPILPPSPSSDETANWKTYTNTKVGFLVKYPVRYPEPALPSGTPDSPTLYADGNEDNTEILFGKTSTDSVSLIVFPFSGSLDSFVGIETKTPSVSPVWVGGLPTIAIGDQKVDGVEAKWYKTTYADGKRAESEKVYFINKGHGFIFNTDFNHNEEEVKQILSTFKFTN